MSGDLRDSVLYEECYRIKERRSNRRFVAVLLCIALAFIGLRLYWSNRFGGVQVDGGSMKKTLQGGQQLIMEYTSEKNPAKRGDIIIVKVKDYPEFAGSGVEFLIKRLIAIEGDTVRCTDGQVEIQYAGTDTFVTLDEPYAYYEDKSIYDFAGYEYTVGKGEVFFLGDNRNHSQDSRFYEHADQGSRLKDRLYKQTDIIGKVPSWALEHQKILEKIFFYKEKRAFLP